MPVTSRRQQIANISGAGKKTPMYSYDHSSKRVRQTGTGIPEKYAFVNDIKIQVLNKNIFISWNSIENIDKYLVTLYSSLNYNVKTSDTLVNTYTSTSNNIVINIEPSHRWYAATITAANLTSQISHSSMLEQFSISYDEPGLYTHDLPSLLPNKSWNIEYEILGGGGGGGGGAQNIGTGFHIKYGDKGSPGQNAELVLGSFVTTQTSLTSCVSSHVANGGNIGFAGDSGGNSFMTDGEIIEESTGGVGGYPGFDTISTLKQVADSVSKNPGSGGKGGDSNTPGDKGVPGYIKFTATLVP